MRVTSKDGTRIAYEREGLGPPLILVDGALCYRESGPARPLAALLKKHFSVITYDRRGRGASTDTAPYALEREVEDIDALAREAGEPVFLYGISSGAALALEASARLRCIRKAALYEAVYVVDATTSPLPEDYLPRLQEMVDAGRRSDAVKFFMRRVGVPGFALLIMPLMPVWKKLKGVAHTLPYDISIIKDHSNCRPLSRHQWASASIPIMVANGTKSPLWLRNSAKHLADILPNAEYRSVLGQTHMLKPQAITPLLVDFFLRG